VQYEVIINASASVAGKYSSFVYFMWNIGATISIVGVGRFPAQMFAGKIAFLSLFPLVAAIGGLIIKLQQKNPRSRSTNPCVFVK